MDKKGKSFANRDVILVTMLGVFFSNLVISIPDPGLQLIFLVMLMPIPYIYLFTKYGYKSGNMAVAFTALVNSIFFNFFGLVMTLVSFGLMGVVLGGALHERLKSTRTLLLTTATSIVSGSSIYYLARRIGIIHQFKILFKKSFTELPYWQDLVPGGLSEDTIASLADFMATILPAMTIIFIMVLGYLCYRISVKLLRWRGLKVPKVLPIKNWLFPRWIMFLYIVLQIMPKDFLSANILLVLGFILAVEGISTTVYFGDKWGVYSWLRNIIIIVGLVFVGFVFFFIGIIDNIFKLRMSKKKKQE